MKTILKIALAVALVSGAVSCSSMLEEKPYSFVSNLPDSEAGASQYIAGVYSFLLNDMFRWDHFPKVLDVDNDYNTGAGWSLGDIGAGNFDASKDTGMESTWTKSYVLIHRANNAIEQIEAMKNLSPAFKANALGEAKFLKAWAYFILVRAYGDVPIFYKSVSAGADLNQPRKPLTEVWAYIIELLNEAQDGMYRNTDAAYQPGHASAGAAAALLAKSYLFIASASLPTGEVTVKGGRAFHEATLKDERGEPGDDNWDKDVKVKILENPVALTHTKTQVAGYEGYNSTEYFILARDKAKEVIDGIYGTYDLLPYADLWKASSQYVRGEHMWGIKGISGNSVYRTGVHRYYSGVQNSDGVVIEGMFYGNSNAWYRLFEKNDFRVALGVKHRWVHNDHLKFDGGAFYPSDAEWSIRARGYWVEMNEVAGTIKNIYNDPITGVEYVIEPPYADGRAYTNEIIDSYIAYTTKYDDVTDPKNANADGYFPVLRFADVLLIYAEAAAEANGSPTADALAALNRVRVRSNATPFVLAGAGNIGTPVAFRSAVLEERARELNLEGDRRWDLIRWGIYLQVMNGIEGGYDEVGIRKIREPKTILYPVPRVEMSSNPNIGYQNPGWN